MQFTISEVNGTESPYEWFAEKVKKYAKDKYNLNLRVTVKRDQHSEIEAIGVVTARRIEGRKLKIKRGLA